jgi:hypothetical protein
MNPQMVSEVKLSRDVIDCIVFWTKNPAPMLDQLHLLADYPFYFLFTLTPYGNSLECGLPPKVSIIDTFIDLSKQIGKERVLWRYDPVILTDNFDENDHYRHFTDLCRQLSPYTGVCIVSFLDMYKKTERHLKGVNISIPDESIMRRMIGRFHKISMSFNIQLNTCGESIDFSSQGASPAGCIDDEHIRSICGYPIDVSKDRNQRKTCGCIESIDIGAYDSCNHRCLYCYANSSPQRVIANNMSHDPNSPLLVGYLTGNEKINLRNVQSHKSPCKHLF